MSTMARSAGRLKAKKGGSRRKMSVGSKIAVYAGLLLYAAFLVFPFLIILITSFTTDYQLMTSPDFVWAPDPVSLEGYQIIFENDPNMVNGVSSLFVGFFNTMWQTLIPVIGGLAISGLAAYAYAKYNFPGKNKFFSANVLLMTIPVTAGTVGYLFYDAIGWTSGGASVLPLIVPKLFGSAGTIFFIYPYVKGVPTGVIDAAKIDGMGFFSIFFRIVFPLSMPVFLAQFLFGFVSGYNNYSSALIYLASEKQLWTLQLALQQLISYISGSGGYNNAACAATLMSMLPLILLYCFVQKFFIEGITMGSVKG